MKHDAALPGRRARGSVVRRAIEVGIKFEKVMEGYHDLADHGPREVYKIEG